MPFFRLRRKHKNVSDQLKNSNLGINARAKNSTIFRSPTSLNFEFIKLFMTDNNVHAAVRPEPDYCDLDLYITRWSKSDDDDNVHSTDYPRSIYYHDADVYGADHSERNPTSTTDDNNDNNDEASEKPLGVSKSSKSNDSGEFDANIGSSTLTLDLIYSPSKNFAGLSTPHGFEHGSQLTSFDINTKIASLDDGNRKHVLNQDPDVIDMCDENLEKANEQSLQSSLEKTEKLNNLVLEAIQKTDSPLFKIRDVFDYIESSNAFIHLMKGSKISQEIKKSIIISFLKRRELVFKCPHCSTINCV
ncbi:uncharacterized protein ASCRUDRAFT_74928 [Ascoidea rubescens DSM 1968]|uniref:Uncharacterized protein n=1 Tax=Ascoidea rubescens DSM 1968 TaxID=1344418 RepID=A0A1D2VLT8_9ASCO|nr:hypothetical protein ASCRUDRAFT_74928 [Ascoidea rubescens DSM 1968]ODV62572.1 hypothetical protein ASCRUDRAFT_74928 [Ascoidea rubescens DSM 1968]